jgi:hypothetical protein
MLTVAERAPVAVGLNVTLIAQFAFAASVAGLTGHVFVCAKSPALAPVMLTPVIVSAAVPLFVNVTACMPLVLPTFCEANVSDTGASVTAGVFAAAPVPARPTACGLPVALSAMLTLAARAPVAVGLNVTLIAQFAFAASVAGLTGHVFVCAKSPAFAPVMLTPVIVRAAVPVFVNVTV